MTTEPPKKHELTKQRAVDFVAGSPMNAWVRGVCISRIENVDFPDHPRLIAQKISEYLELCLTSAKARNDVELVCDLCKCGFNLRCILFEKDEIMECSPECEYVKQELGLC